MNRRHLLALQCGFEIEVEIGRVHADEGGRLLGHHAVAEFCPHGNEPGIVTQHFNVPAYRQALHRKPGIESGSLHLGPADAGEPEPARRNPLERLHELRPEEIPGGLAGHHPDERGCGQGVSARCRGASG